MKRQPVVHIYQSGDSFRWNLLGGNGEIMAQGEAHPDEANAKKAWKRIAKAAAQAKVIVEQP